MYGKTTSDGTYSHRYKENWRISLKPLGRIYVDHLCEQYESSDPTTGSNSERNKDSYAMHALSTAGELVNQLCGWAIDHQMGKAALGLGWLPVMAVQGMNEGAKLEFEK